LISRRKNADVLDSAAGSVEGPESWCQRVRDRAIEKCGNATTIKWPIAAFGEGFDIVPDDPAADELRAAQHPAPALSK
jgi:hypothetical protein